MKEIHDLAAVHEVAGHAGGEGRVGGGGPASDGGGAGGSACLGALELVVVGAEGERRGLQPGGHRGLRRSGPGRLGQRSAVAVVIIAHFEWIGAGAVALGLEFAFPLFFFSCGGSCNFETILLVRDPLTIHGPSLVVGPV